jgi:hypothetical protein
VPQRQLYKANCIAKCIHMRHAAMCTPCRSKLNFVNAVLNRCEWLPSSSCLSARQSVTVTTRGVAASLIPCRTCVW